MIPYRRMLFLLLIGLVVWSYTTVTAQSPDIIPQTILNLSNTVTSSTQPILLADKTGSVHIFWSEDIGGRPSGSGTTSGNTIMYARWDGVNWSEPLDILLTPIDPGTGNSEAAAWQPHAIIDDLGRIHIIWVGLYPERLFYSTAHASEAGSANAWSTPISLVEDLSGTTYSIDIEYVSPETIHIVYARVHWEKQYARSKPRTLGYIRSTDGGVTWSDPVNVAVSPDLERGFSNVRLLTAPDGRLFASWTEWDQSGNGQAVYMARSLNDGITWDAPVKLAEIEPDDYERDWVQLAWLENDRLVATWEGGFRAYRQFMYSNDNGATWSEPSDPFYWLIGENGFTEFVRDSDGNLHLFVAQRVREGSIGRRGCLGLWHSVWQGGEIWSDPELVGGCNNMVDPKVTMVNGNQLIAAWFSSVVGEVMMMTGQISGVPLVEPEPWSAEDILEETTTESASTSKVEDAPTRQPLSTEVISTSPREKSSPGTAVFLGVAPVMLLLTLVFIIKIGVSRR